MKPIIFSIFFFVALQANAGNPQLIINEFLADPASGSPGDANGDGVRDGTQDEFVELYNTTANPLNISGWRISDGFGVRHTFPADTEIPGNCSIVVFGGGAPSGTFGNSLVQVATSGALGLNNSGDSITVDDGVNPISSYTYGTEGGDDQSITRYLDTQGTFIKHSEAPTSGGSLFSPGTLVDGTSFSGCANIDNPPVVSSTIPEDGSTGFVNSSDLTVNFSELVDVSDTAVSLSCSQSGAVTFADNLPLNDGIQIIINPDNDLADTETCALTVLATEVTDIDDMPDNMVDDVVVNFTVGFPVLEIFQIQGNGLTSPYDGQSVTTNDNVVTAVGPNGFYIQTPDDRDDNVLETSNGIYVYTGFGGPPPYSVGDMVDVTGEIIEFEGLTEFTSPNSQVISVDSQGNPLPTALVLDNTFPSPDPTVFDCGDSSLGRECFEGMLFEMPQGFVSSASDGFFSFFDITDMLIKAGDSRAFREPGIEYPGLVDLQVFDGNPELIEMSIDDLGLPYQALSAGTEISASGIMTESFGDFELHPTVLNIINENVIPSTVRDGTIDEITLASANLFRLFNDINDSGDDDYVEDSQVYADRLTKISSYIINDMKSPLIIGLQEIENIIVMNDLAAAISTAGGPTYTTALVEGNDQGDIDVAYLYQADYLSNVVITQLGAAEIHTFDGSLLHDRPPLHLSADVTVGNAVFPVNVLVVHMRSRGGIDGAEADRVRNKRLEQANSIANMIDGILNNTPNDSLYVIGDFNAFQFTDGYVDVVGQITGTAVEDDNLVWVEPLFVADPLTQAVQTLAAEEQYSFVFRGSAQVLDNALMNDVGLMNLNDMEFVRGQADANVSFEEDNSNSLRSTDHDGFVLFIKGNNDLIYKNGFE